jgi:hypothetical protein
MELNSLNVRTPFTASNATFALNSSVCRFRFATTTTPPLLDNTTPSQSQLNYLSKKRGELHSLPTAGEFELVVYYQADEPRAAKPAELLPGTYSSERVAFSVIP